MSALDEVFMRFMSCLVKDLMHRCKLLAAGDLGGRWTRWHYWITWSTYFLIELRSDVGVNGLWNLQRLWCCWLLKITVWTSEKNRQISVENKIRGFGIRYVTVYYNRIRLGNLSADRLITRYYIDTRYTPHNSWNNIETGRALDQYTWVHVCNGILHYLLPRRHILYRDNPYKCQYSVISSRTVGAKDVLLFR